MAVLVWCLTGLNVRGDRSAVPEEFSFDEVTPVEPVFRDRNRIRRLNVARRALQRNDAATAFTLLHGLLEQQPDGLAESSTSASLPCQGVRAAVIEMLTELPAVLLRQWNQSCDGPARRDLQQAIRQSSRKQLERIALRYPLSQTAADALLLQILWERRHDEHSSRESSLKKLQQWQRLGILSRSQKNALRLLQSRQNRSWKTTPAVIRHPDFPAPKSDWSWQLSPWHLPGAASSVPGLAGGSQFGVRPGSLPPVVFPDAVIVRTPAGIARLDRDAGTLQWFLPFPTGGQKDDFAFSRPGESDDSFLLSERMEHHRSTIWFLDSDPRDAFTHSGDAFAVPPVRTAGGGVGATRIVALQAGPQPAVLWCVDDLPVPGTSPSDAQNVSVPSPESRRAYRFVTSVEALSKTDDIHPPSADRMPHHRFLCAPVVRGGRLYVTSVCSGLAWLNCLSARRGHVLWQQPLAWNRDADGSFFHAVAVGGVCGDTVVCLFDSGLIIGCSVQDGHIRWAQSCLTKAEQQEQPGHLSLVARSDPDFVPDAGMDQDIGQLWIETTADRIFCGRRRSPVLVCLDSESGTVLWSAPRAVRHGISAGQPDIACAGLIDGAMILYGYGHCRALRLDDGTEIWFRAVGPHLGRVLLDGPVLRIVLNAGHLVNIDAGSGRVLSTCPMPAEQTGSRLAADARGLVDVSAWRAASRSWRRSAHIPSAEPDSRPIARSSSPADIHLLQPERLGSVSEQLAQARRLIGQGRRQAAELLLLNMLPGNPAESGQGRFPRRQQWQSLLNDVRSAHLAPGIRAAPPISVRDTRFTEYRSVTDSYRLEAFSRQMRRSGVQLPRNLLPAWYRFRLGPGLAGTSQTVLLDVERAIQTASVDESAYQFPAWQTHSRSDTSPALLLIHRARQIGVLSLLSTEPLRPLWWQRLRDSDGHTDHPLLEGPLFSLTSRRLVIVFPDGLQVLHPFTGETLWERRWKHSSDTRHLHGQSLRVFHTNDHIILVSSLGPGYVILNANDGTIVREASYEAHRTARIISGCLVTADRHGRLQAQHLITGQTLSIDLPDIRDIQPADAAGPGLALIRSGEDTVSIVHVPTGTVRLQIAVPELRPLDHREILPPLLLRRCGLLLVVVSGRDWRVSRSRSSFGEPQTGDGVLVCIDPDTWNVLWKRPVSSEVIPPVYGDPSPFLITWSRRPVSAQGLGVFSRFSGPDALTVSVIDVHSGRQIARAMRRMSGHPLRIVHDATSHVVDITTAENVLRMTYQPAEPGESTAE